MKLKKRSNREFRSSATKEFAVQWKEQRGLMMLEWVYLPKLARFPASLLEIPCSILDIHRKRNHEYPYQQRVLLPHVTDFAFTKRWLHWLLAP